MDSIVSSCPANRLNKSITDWDASGEGFYSPFAHVSKTLLHNTKKRTSQPYKILI